jgi:hypothetical protein
MTKFELYRALERILNTEGPQVFAEAHRDGLLVGVGNQEFWVTAEEQG